MTERTGGIVASRHLVAVQTFDIARLTPAPIPLVPGVFIAVSGLGPKGDSNGSGKTSFLAAVSLLLGDSQWRLEANGAQAAAGLLFSPKSAGTDTLLQHTSADKGYIIGVFADRDCPEQTFLTVWLRLARTSPYIKVRWDHGLHVVTGENDTERYAQCDDAWAALPATSELGPRRFAEELYGHAPRCMAYLDTTLRRSAPSLLSQQMTEMNPATIGSALIELTGRQGLLENEEKHRARLAEERENLRTREAEDLRARQNEQADLEAVTNRAKAREHLAAGEHAWRLHYARGFLDVLDQEWEQAGTVAALDREVATLEGEAKMARDALAEVLADTGAVERAATAKTAHDDAQNRRNEALLARQRLTDALNRLAQQKADLTHQAEGWSGATVADADAALATAQEDWLATRALVATAEDAHSAAETTLAQARAGAGGPAGPALDALHTAGIPAVSLLDTITLTDDVRGEWEPRLWPHAGDVVIAPTDETTATAALIDIPGASWIVADGPLDTPPMGLPAGVGAGAPIARFLTTLADQVAYVPAPDRGTQRSLGHTVLGGFPDPVVGRDARIAAAAGAAEATKDRLERAARAENLAQAVMATAEADMSAARAMEQIGRVDEEISRQRAALPGAEESLAAAVQEVERCHEAYVKASVDVTGREQQLALLQKQVAFATASLGEKINARDQAKQRLDALYADFWRDGWGGTAEEAQACLAAEDEATRKATHRTLRSRAAEALNAALECYLASVGGVLPAELKDIQERREAWRDGGPGVSSTSIEFKVLARPLRDLLDARAEHDITLQYRIERAQAARADAISLAQDRVTEIGNQLTGLREAITQRLEHSLNAISAAWNRLSLASGGFGARLRINSIEPATPTSAWAWEITPEWKRSSTSGFVSYRESANGAQIKLYAVQLVLAALLAADGARGRVLILDELGNSLGEVNRKDALDALATVAAEQDLTILGTTQDSVLSAAAHVAGQILWFSHATDTDAYNQPTRMWGYDPDRTRVEMTRDWLTAGRTLV